MFEQIILTTLLLGWLFYRFARQDEERQSLLDLAAERGIALSDERAARAARAGTSRGLRVVSWPGVLVRPRTLNPPEPSTALECVVRSADAGI